MLRLAFVIAVTLSCSSATANANDWVTEIDTDPLDDTPWIFGTLVARDNSAGLSIKCWKGKPCSNFVILSTLMPTTPGEGNGNETTVALRIDKSLAVDTPARLLTDSGKVHFAIYQSDVDQNQKLILALLKAKSQIGIGAGTMAYGFTLAKSNKKKSKLLEYCFGP